MSMPGTVGVIFEKPEGPVTLDDKGRWWITREELCVDEHGHVTVIIGDGEHVTKITATPEMLARVGDAIAGQGEGAVVNTREIRPGRLTKSQQKAGT